MGTGQKSLQGQCERGSAVVVGQASALQREGGRKVESGRESGFGEGRIPLGME